MPQAIWQTMKEEDVPLPVKIVAYPIMGLIWLGAIGLFFWLDLGLRWRWVCRIC